MSAKSVERGPFTFIYHNSPHPPTPDPTQTVQIVALSALNQMSPGADAVTRTLQNYQDRQLLIKAIQQKYAAKRAPLEARRRQVETELDAVKLDDEKFDEKTSPIHEALDKIANEIGALFQAEADEIQKLLPTK